MTVGPESLNMAYESQQRPNLEQIATSRNLVQAVEEVYQGVLADASARGLSHAEVKAMLVAGWNSGAIPRVVEGIHYRGSGYTLNILHGEVPADVFDHFYEDEDYGVVLPNEDYPDGSVTLVLANEDIPTRPNPDDPSAFYIETFRLPQVAEEHSSFQAVQVAARLAKVQALMSPTQG